MTPLPRPVALTRAVSPSIVRCELTHLEREPIDVDRDRAQHADYEALLERLGCEVRRVPPLPEHPDAVFIEDTAVVLPALAIVTRPGAASRRAEVEAVAEALAPLRALARITAPGTLDGGDVLRTGRTLFVGRTGRTNDEGIAQLAAFATPHGFTVRPVEVTGCLHLKSAVTEVADGTLLLNPAWVHPSTFEGWRLIEVDPSEPMGANAVRAGGAIVYGEAYPRTRERLERAGLIVHTVDASEVAKAEGAVTCCSVLVEP
ncbi:MAG: dimethylargininase [Proteobacteria bacterium]|nr:dimethylargininase [Pseudomonadota bacterium]